MRASPSDTRIVRGIFAALGVLCLVIAAAGVVLPLIPFTGPTLLAAFFFARSSPRFDRWLTEHRLFGPVVRDWRAGAGFTVRAKTIAVTAIVASFALTGSTAVTGGIGRALLVALAVTLCAYVATRPTKQPTVTSVQEPPR